MKNKKKVRTCGNCVHLVKNDTIITSCYRKPSTPTDCPYHKFKNNNYNE